MFSYLILLWNKGDSPNQKKKEKKEKKKKGDSQNKKINKDFGINETCPFG